MTQILNEISNLNTSKYEMGGDQFIHFDDRSTLYEFVRQYIKEMLLSFVVRERVVN